jgi:selenium metabolism protein YedF
MEVLVAKQLLIITDSLGRGSDELGRILMKNFIYSVARNDDKPAAIMLMNEGVRLACEGSDSIDDLKLLAEYGVALRVCGTCLDFLHVKDTLAVGEVGTMPDTVAAVLGPNDIVTIS